MDGMPTASNISDTLPGLHPANFLLVLVLVEGGSAQVAPPLEQHRVADQLKPGGELQVGLVEHGLQFLGIDVACIANFVRARRKINIRLNKQNVVNCDVC